MLQPFEDFARLRKLVRGGRVIGGEQEPCNALGDRVRGVGGVQVCEHNHGNALVRLAWGYTNNAADHDDLLQDILVAIWRALPRFRGESSERTFVFRVAHNRGITFASRRRVHDSLDQHAGIADPRPGPDEQVARATEHARLIAAVRTLPQTLRDTVMLRLEDCSISEIAAVLNVTENNVSVRLNRFLASFDASGFEKRGNMYYSANFASARYRLTVDINASLGGIEVAWVDR